MIADAETTRDDEFHTKWEDDIIPLDPVEENASPKIGLGFAVDRPIDIRAGGGEDEVQYNVNAPVSVDGGTGFDKLVVLGTEFADDFAITSKAIYGAGLNVRYTTVEVIENRQTHPALASGMTTRPLLGMALIQQPSRWPAKCWVPLS